MGTSSGFRAVSTNPEACMPLLLIDLHPPGDIQTPGRNRTRGALGGVLRVSVCNTMVHLKGVRRLRFSEAHADRQEVGTDWVHGETRSHPEPWCPESTSRLGVVLESQVSVQLTRHRGSGISSTAARAWWRRLDIGTQTAGAASETPASFTFSAPRY